jgi:hypothetical protein
MPASVNGVRLKNRKTGEITDMPIDGVFVAIGHAPAVSLFKDKLKHKPNGYLWTAPGFDCHRCARRLRRRRRDRRHLPPGRDRGRHGLHGGAWKPSAIWPDMSADAE